MGHKFKKIGDLKKKVTIRLSEEHLEELEYNAKDQGTSVTFLIRHLIIRYIKMERDINSGIAEFRRLDGRRHL